MIATQINVLSLSILFYSCIEVFNCSKNSQKISSRWLMFLLIVFVCLQNWFFCVCRNIYIWFVEVMLSMIRFALFMQEILINYIQDNILGVKDTIEHFLIYFESLLSLPLLTNNLIICDRINAIGISHQLHCFTMWSWWYSSFQNNANA